MTNILNCPQVTITVWGDFALFSRPEGKVERITYPVPTPSAVRGMLASIYSKPAEFYWQVQRIEVLKKIQYATFKRNELKSKMPRIPAGNPMKACLLIEEDRTQRQSVVLRDVRYRITAQIVPRPDFPGSAIQLYNQFERRADVRPAGDGRPGVSGLFHLGLHRGNADPGEPGPGAHGVRRI